MEYGIEIVASPGIPGIELENLYLEYSWSPKSYTQNTVDHVNSFTFPYRFFTFPYKTLSFSI